MQLLGLGVESPRHYSPRSQSPRLQTPNGSPRTDDTIIQFAKVKLPLTFQLIRRGQASGLFRVIEKTFEVLNELQFQCLPHKYRALGVQQYIASKTLEKAEEMEQLYAEWLEKEQEYIEERLEYSLDDLTEKQLDLIPLIRQTIFRVLYQEQEELKAQDPCHSFISIAGIDGSKNSGYYPYLMQVDQRQQNTQAAQTRAEKASELFEKKLKERGYDLVKMNPREKDLVRVVKTVFFEARLAAICDEPDEVFYDSISLHFELFAAGLKTSSFSSTLSAWEEKKCQRDVERAKEEADKRWAVYAKREATAFEELYGYKLKTLSEEEKKFCNAVRSAIYQLVYEEQSSDLPFISICNEKGGLNEEYWIDKLNAQARKNRETPIEEPWHFKDFRDYDAVRINTAPPKAKADGITDANRMRITGAVTPDFCRDVLESIRRYADGVKEKIGFSEASAKGEVDYADIFESDALTWDEKIIFLQNEFCEALAQTHYLRGHTQGMLNKLNIKVVLGEPSLGLKMAQRNARKSDADKGLLRKSSGSLFEPTRQVQERVVLKKSQTSEMPQQMESPRFDKSSFDHECMQLGQDIQNLLAQLKSENDATPIGTEESREYFKTYAISLEFVSKELNRLICMLQSFAKALDEEETARLARRAAATFMMKSRRPSSVALRPKSRARLLTEENPPLRARSVSLLAPKPPMKMVSPIEILRTSGRSNPEVASPETSSPVSPRVSDINPERFRETARLLSLAKNLFMQASEVIVKEAYPQDLTAALEKLTL